MPSRAGVDRHGAHGRGQRCEQVLAEPGAAGAVAALAGEHPGDSEVAKPRHVPHRPEDDRADAERVEHRRPEHDERADEVGVSQRHDPRELPAPALADQDHRAARLLREPMETRLDPAHGALGAVGVQHDARTFGTRASPTQPACEDAERLVARHESGHEEHRGLSRRASRAQKVAIGEQPSELEAIAQLASKRGYRRRARRQRRRHVPNPTRVGDGPERRPPPGCPPPPHPGRERGWPRPPWRRAPRSRPRPATRRSGGPAGVRPTNRATAAITRAVAAAPPASRNAARAHHAPPARSTRPPIARTPVSSATPKPARKEAAATTGIATRVLTHGKLPRCSAR